MEEGKLGFEKVGQTGVEGRRTFLGHQNRTAARDVSLETRTDLIKYFFVFYVQFFLGPN